MASLKDLIGRIEAMTILDLISEHVEATIEVEPVVEAEVVVGEDTQDINGRLAKKSNTTDSTTMLRSKKFILNLTRCSSSKKSKPTLATMSKSVLMKMSFAFASKRTLILKQLIRLSISIRLQQNMKAYKISSGIRFRQKKISAKLQSKNELKKNANVSMKRRD